MSLSIERAAVELAEQLSKSDSQPLATGWRWGTVTANNGNGTLDVNMAGSVLQSVRATESSAAGAVAGDRVLLRGFGSEILAVGMRQSSSSPAVVGYETSIDYNDPSIDVPKNTATTLLNITLSPGTWLLTGGVHGATTVGATFFLYLGGLSETSAVYEGGDYVYASMTTFRATGARLRFPTKDTSYYLNCECSAEATVTYAYLRAVRLL